MITPPYQNMAKILYHYFIIFLYFGKNFIKIIKNKTLFNVLF